MNYKEAQLYLESLSQYGIVPGLDSMRRLCEGLDNPQDALKFIQVAGTNGKGSISVYVASVIKAAGMHVGLYTSPAVVDYRERFMVDGRMVTQVAFCSCLERVKSVAESIAEAGFPHPTTFEIETATAFLLFKEKGCELVVLEAGMGGELDATNIVSTTLVSAFASISMDHMQFLGKNLSEIALTKAGIIKPNAYAVVGRQELEVEQILKKKAVLQKSKYVYADIKKIKNPRYGLKKQTFQYGSYKSLEITLSGQYQMENAIVAIEVIQCLRKCGYDISDAAMYQGLKEASWPGRFMLVKKKPVIVVDGAHNIDAIKRLRESVDFYLQEYIQADKLILIMGVLKDKEYEQMVETICPVAKHVITLTPPENPRALSAYELAKAVQSVNASVTAVDSIEEAIEVAKLFADKESAIVVCGSLSYLGRFIKCIETK